MLVDGPLIDWHEVTKALNQNFHVSSYSIADSLTNIETINQMKNSIHTGIIVVTHAHRNLLENLGKKFGKEAERIFREASIEDNDSVFWIRPTPNQSLLIVMVKSSFDLEKIFRSMRKIKKINPMVSKQLLE